VAVKAASAHQAPRCRHENATRIDADDTLPPGSTTVAISRASSPLPEPTSSTRHPDRSLKPGEAPPQPRLAGSGATSIPSLLALHHVRPSPLQSLPTFARWIPARARRHSTHDQRPRVPAAALRLGGMLRRRALTVNQGVEHVARRIGTEDAARRHHDGHITPSASASCRTRRRSRCSPTSARIAIAPPGAPITGNIRARHGEEPCLALLAVARSRLHSWFQRGSSVVPTWFQRIRTHHDACEGAFRDVGRFRERMRSIAAGASASAGITNQLLCH